MLQSAPQLGVRHTRRLGGVSGVLRSQCLDRRIGDVMHPARFVPETAHRPRAGPRPGE